ncbi:MAG: metallopeptidase family protein [Anaerolineae bacterium]|nr:metallopeptidase family protein [Anaerolineae bacterium]MDW8072201.1 metallopeptidase family protein [Anaerolineae bacterium]
MDRYAFERLVVEAVEALPEAIRTQLENVEFVVEEWPDPVVLRRMGLRNPASLLGFYHGIPRTQRNSHYGMVLPDKISIYRQPILRRCRNWREVRELVFSVVRHEIAHHFGISDERLEELGAY